VRPSARVPIGNAPEPFVYIESGYTWLLWVGGVPLLVGFITFLVTNLRATRRRAQQNDQIGVASTAAFVSLSVVAVLTVLDPHLTLRGSGDLLFVLLALAHVVNRRREKSREDDRASKHCATQQLAPL
jgi:protein-S-isoprenylcysteine O-methyltransferase Ste14